MLISLPISSKRRELESLARSFDKERVVYQSFAIGIGRVEGKGSLEVFQMDGAICALDGIY
jgi:hypothetical protein